jgi:hypothetical protein
VGRKFIVHGRQTNLRGVPTSRENDYRTLPLRTKRPTQQKDTFKRITSEPLMAAAGVTQPVELSVPADPHRHLPHTMAKLTTGKQLRVVVLGDSIVNDTFRMRGPGWGAIGKHYDSRVTVVKSVRGSCGAQWYAKENRIQEWVLAHKPDLVMIGGCVTGRTAVTIGPMADSMLHSINVGKAFLSVAGITDRGYFNSNMMLVESEKAMLDSADQTIVVADSSKFGKVSLSRLCGLHEVNAVVTDSSVDSTWKEHLELAGVQLVLAESGVSNQESGARN